MRQHLEGDKMANFDVVVVGGGASGVPAALQAARMGAKVLLIEETVWLGGMITSAGVSALDGNDAILSGIHREFVHALWKECGGREAVDTGWVSHTLFEPKVGQRILREMVEREENITLWLETRVVEVHREGHAVTGLRVEDGREVQAHVVIEATDCGDVVAMSGALHRLGRESRKHTGEAIGPDETDNCIQDSTLCITTREYENGSHRSVPAPPNYSPEAYEGSVREVTSDPDGHSHEVHSWEKFISYGRLPNGRRMINWPIHGNDLFVPEFIEQSHDERRETVARMKEHALGFLHYIQTVCGHPEIGIDEGAFPTEDGLPLIPYIRESRRIEAVTMFHLSDVIDRHANPRRAIHRAGIAVGDYFIDHHHGEDLAENFPDIQAVTVPMGCLVPLEIDGLIAAEKSIGVTHNVNGVTRLQPIVMNIGQAAGALAASAARMRVQPRDVNPREVQRALQSSGVLLMPFADVGPEHPQFEAIHRIGACDVMRGFDEPRRCEFRPDQLIVWMEAQAALAPIRANGLRPLEGAVDLQPGDFPMTRGEFAVKIDQMFDPFNRLPIDW